MWGELTIIFDDSLLPEPLLTVSEWADANRFLAREAASEFGPWRTSRTPYLKKVMDSLSSFSSYQKVIVMKGTQLGFTEAGCNWIGYIIDICPSTTLMVMPTDGTMKRNSKIRINPMIEACPSLKAKVARNKGRSSDNTVEQKNFPGGVLLMAGANSPVGLRSIPVRNLMLDEVDGYPLDLGGEGSPIDLAIERTNTYSSKKKIFIISTPTRKGISVIEKEFENSDQHYFELPCPHCGGYQRLVFENLKWESGNPKTTKYQCAHCGELIEEQYKTEMMAAGIWVSYAPEKSARETIGFHINSLYSPLGWLSWSAIAKKYEDAMRDPFKMITFVNTTLAEAFEESGEAPKWEAIYNKSRLENNKANEIPSNVCFLTAGVDIQKDRIELEIVGWCSDKQSYSIDFRVLLGNTTLPDVWSELAGIVDETWIKADGAEMQLKKMAVDTGYNTTEVHAFCRRFSSVRVVPIKGQDSLGLPVAPPRQIDYNRNGKKIGRLKQWNVGVSLLKGELYSWLLLEPKPEGGYPPCYCHFLQYDQKYFEGITAEQYLPKTHKWKKTYERNEPLDCRIYARAAANIAGLDRMKPEQLNKMGNVTVDFQTEVPSSPSTERRKRKIEDSI